MSTRVLCCSFWQFCHNFTKPSKLFSVLFLFLLVSLSFADWVSFDDGRVRSSATKQDIATCTDISVQERACNLSISIPGAFENRPDDFGLLAGNYSVFSLYGSSLKIVNNNISGTFRPEKLGEPNLPQARFHVLIPYSVSTDQLEIEVINTNFKPLVGLYEIGPVQKQVIDSYYPGIHRDTRVFQKKMDIYSKDAFFSHPLEYETFLVNKYRVLEIRYCPMQYNPVTNKVLATNRAQFVIKYNGTVINNNVKPNNFTNTIYKTTFNGITGTRNQPYEQVSRGGKFVIVSGAPLIDCPTMDEFIAYREGQGYEHVKTIDADATGTSQITSELESLFNSEDLEYLLVIGNEKVVEIPTGGSDYHYKKWAWLNGSDKYEDIMMGIFLCNTETGFKQIVQRQKWQEAGGN